MPTLKPPLESTVVRECLHWLAYNGFLAYRVNVGMLPNGVGGWRTNSMRGMSDIHAIGPGGIAIWIECKRVGGPGPTPDQLRFMGDVRAAGGIALVARSTLDLERELGARGLFV